MTKDEETDMATNSLESVDAFHNGAFSVVQPKDKGYRSGLDALLLAAALPENIQGLLADLGAGTGVAGLAALNFNRDLDLLLVERNPKMSAFAKRSLGLRKNQHLSGRVKTIETDITQSGVERLKAGLNPDSVDHVIMNPPYNKEDHRTPPDPTRAEAFMLGEGGLDSWFRTASSITKPGGTLALIYRTENIGDVLACARGRFGGLEILPIHSYADKPAKRFLARGTRASRAPLKLFPGFVVHAPDGTFTQQAEAIFKAEARLTFAQ